MGDSVRKIGVYNAWQDNDLADNFLMYLAGSARKCYDGLHPSPRRSLSKRNAAGDSDLPNGEIGVRQLFVQQFTNGIVNFKKASYWHIVTVSRNPPLMNEFTKGYHLMGGLCPCLRNVCIV